MPNARSIKVGVLCGGPSEEREVSLRTGAAMAGALRRLGYPVVTIDAGLDLPRRLVEADIQVAMIALHGTMGEDGAVQGLLEVMGIPYTGSGIGTSAICMDKGITKRLLQAAGLPTPPWRELTLAADPVSQAEQMAVLVRDFPPPWFVKPMASGSSVGIQRVVGEGEVAMSLRAAARVSPRLLVEREIPGREVTLGVLSGQPMPLIEIRPQSGFYDYANKYTPGRTQYLVPPPGLDETRTREIVALGLAGYETLGCRGLARLDFMIDGEGQAWIIEVNTVPGMTETSLVPKAAAAMGLPFDDLVERILLAGLDHATAGGGGVLDG